MRLNSLHFGPRCVCSMVPDLSDLRQKAGQLEANLAARFDAAEGDGVWLCLLLSVLRCKAVAAGGQPVQRDSMLPKVRCCAAACYQDAVWAGQAACCSAANCTSLLGCCPGSQAARTTTERQTARSRRPIPSSQPHQLAPALIAILPLHTPVLQAMRAMMVKRTARNRRHGGRPGWPKPNSRWVHLSLECSPAFAGLLERPASGSYGLKYGARIACICYKH